VSDALYKMLPRIQKDKQRVRFSRKVPTLESSKTRKAVAVPVSHVENFGRISDLRVESLGII
jgi:hypothetical protein